MWNPIGFLFDTAFGLLPWRVQLGCLVFACGVVGALVAWAVWS